jgi:lysophospholipase L1-like esterase
VVTRKVRGAFAQFACTGATFDNGITTPQVDPGFFGSSTLRPAQFGDWDTHTDLNAAYDSAGPDVVLVTFGADDLEFVKIVRDCILNGYASATRLITLACTAQNPGPTVTSSFWGPVVDGTLAGHYRDLVRWIRARGKAAKPPKVPDVVFTTYPDPFPPDGQQCPDSNYLYPDQLTYLSTLVKQLNAVITSTIEQIDRPGVVVADVASVLSGHTWCTSDPWVYGFSIFSVTDPTSFVSQAPFHPTPAGQRAIAAVVTPVVRTLLGS